MTEDILVQAEALKNESDKFLLKYIEDQSIDMKNFVEVTKKKVIMFDYLLDEIKQLRSIVTDQHEMMKDLENKLSRLVTEKELERYK